MEKLAHRLGIENLSRSQVSEMTKGRTNVVGIFPNEDSYLWFVTTYLMEYSTAPQGKSGSGRYDR